MNHTYLIVCIVLGFAFFGCDQANQENIDRVRDTLNQQLADAQKKVSEITKSTSTMTSEEVEKLFTLEYKVVELPQDMPAPEMEQKLSTLGQQRWECRSVVPNGAKLQIFCSRRPETYLRYIPRMF